jgi:hypothetical protein
MPGTPLTTVYVQVAADVTALKVIQHRSRWPGAAGIELLVAAEAPDPEDAGLELVSGQTMVEDQIPLLGESGALYARMLWGGTTGTVHTL